MNRSAALSYLTSNFTKLATDAGREIIDEPEGFKSVIDNALMQYGFRYDQLADATPEVPLKYQALLDYHALNLLVKDFAVRVDLEVESPAVKKTRSQIFKQVSELLAMALRTIKDFGYIEDVANSFSVGKFNLDIYESYLDDPYYEDDCW